MRKVIFCLSSLSLLLAFSAPSVASNCSEATSKQACRSAGGHNECSWTAENKCQTNCDLFSFPDKHTLGTSGALNKTANSQKLECKKRADCKWEAKNQCVAK